MSARAAGRLSRRSARILDLRMGQQLRELYKGSPPVADLSEPGFSNVRHVRIPPWSETELDCLLKLAPELSAVLAIAPARLRRNCTFGNLLNGIKRL